MDIGQQASTPKKGPTQPLRPLVKVEYAYEDSEDHNPKMVTKEVPYTATELAKLKRDFSRSSKESETEYVWRVSLTGGDQILLSEREAEGYWGPGVFLTTGDNRAPWSLTQRAAYWAGGLNPLERGDPLALTGSVDQLVENVHKAACLQMMYDRELKLRQESPMMIPVDPERMTPLVRGLPDSLKPLGIQLQGTIRNTPQSDRVTAALTGVLTPDRRTPGQKVWTWGEVAQELINYGRKYGPVKSESKTVRRAEAKFPPARPSPPNPVNSKKDTISHRKALWLIGKHKGIPLKCMNGLNTEQLEKMVLGWSERGTKGRVSAEPIEHDCLETIEAVYSSRPDLKEEPFEDVDNWFSDDSSFVKQGVRMAGYAVTTTEENLLGKPLQEKWEGPFQVLLTTFTTIRIKERPTWIHYSRVKKAPEDKQEDRTS
ncbi:LOW QUALITY PROTEIN: uncharacterized protein [Nyctibius grandis]|uniref:LOW QUALITY PROTEIN: uncharacterized protein n=1 Tax=Nyctibius grandis TaxID=48427 RepID=UPI0035BC3395